MYAVTLSDVRNPPSRVPRGPGAHSLGRACGGGRRPTGAHGIPGRTGGASVWRVLLSDRDIRAQVDDGRVVLDPYDAAMIQPSSIDVRLDKFFRLFDNHKYPFI